MSAIDDLAVLVSQLKAANAWTDRELGFQLDTSNVHIGYILSRAIRHVLKPTFWDRLGKLCDKDRVDAIFAKQEHERRLDAVDRRISKQEAALVALKAQRHRVVENSPGVE